ncbi:MAG: hypothetical protein Q4C86_03915 [bacterium]|nr:hypothetical protein [bacterium]
MSMAKGQIVRLKNRFADDGAEGMIYENVGRRPEHALCEDITGNYIVEIVSMVYLKKRLP